MPFRSLIPATAGDQTQLLRKCFYCALSSSFRTYYFSPEALDFEESLVGQMYYYATKKVSYAYPGEVWLDFFFSNFV